MPYLAFNEQGELKKVLLDGRERVIIGRDSSCELPFESNTTISRHHCMIYYYPEEDSYVVSDMNSTNGTRLNNERVIHDTILRNGDCLQVGDRKLTFHSGTPETGGVSNMDTVLSMTDSIFPDRDLFRPKPEADIDGFRVQREFLSDDISSVYMVTSLSDERNLLLKWYKMPQPSESVELFRSVMTKNVSLTGDNFPELVGYGAYKGEYCYFVIPFSEVFSLSSLISNRAPMPEKDALKIIQSLAMALDYAGVLAGVCHGTLEPGKILMRQNHDPLICESGLARWLSLYTTGGFSAASMWYISPEQVAGNEPTWSSDLYSLGVILFQMLTGVLPFHSSIPEEVFGMHLSVPFPTPQERNPSVSVSSKTVEVLKNMTRKRAMDRYPSWDAFINELREALRTSSEKKKYLFRPRAQETNSINRNLPSRQPAVKITKSKLL